MSRLPCILLAASFLASAEKVHVYSPFTRIGPDGEVVKPDRGSATPRHILSPGVPRNAFSSFRIVVELDKPGGYFLEIAQNPENAVKATLYRENWIETPQGYIPDTLTRVSIPYQGFATDFRLPGQHVVSFWLDMWVDENAPVDRVKVEPQLWPESVKDWIIYPMEVRVQQPVVPSVDNAPLPALPALTAPADAAAFPFLQSLICGMEFKREAAEERGQSNNRQLLRRNIAQQAALAKSVDAKSLFAKAIQLPDPQPWCKKPVTPPAGPEWYLRFRDSVYRAAGAGE